MSSHPLDPDQRPRPRPVALADKGHFFVGAQEQEGGYAGQMYVEFSVPLHRPCGAKDQAVLFLHGGYQTGGCFTGTPDGRPGWAEDFLRRGFTVYVVDLPGCGRGSLPDPMGSFRTASIELTERIFTQASQAQQQWPGSGLRGDACFEQFLASQQRSFVDKARWIKACVSACAHLLDRVGACSVVAHSLGASIAWPLAQARPGLIEHILAIEPNGPPFIDVPPLGDGQTITRPWGISYLPLAFDPVVDDPAELLTRRADTEPPAPSLSGLRDIPCCVLTASASYHSDYDRLSVDFLRQHGVSVDHLRLADVGLHGNGHMLMLEKNSADIAQLLCDWIRRQARR